MMKHLNISIFGRVQGVGFRYSVKQQAQNLGLFGFVKNNIDKSVYIEVEGEDKKLDEFLKWCKKGPLFSKVEKMEVSKGEIKNFIGFEII